MSQEAAFPLGFLLVSPRRFRQGPMTFEHGRVEQTADGVYMFEPSCISFPPSKKGPSMDSPESDHLFSPLPRLITSWPGQYQGYWATGLESGIPSSTGGSLVCL